MNATYFLFAITFLTSSLVAQDTLYYDIHDNEIADPTNAAKYKVIRMDSLEEDRATVVWFNNNGIPQKSTEYYPYIKDVPDGETRHYYDNGKLREVINYEQGKMNGAVKTCAVTIFTRITNLFGAFVGILRVLKQSTRFTW